MSYIDDIITARRQKSAVAEPAQEQPAVLEALQPMVRKVEPVPPEALALLQEEDQVEEPFDRAEAIELPSLADRALMVKLTRRMYSPYKLDKAESEKYGAGNVNKHLFKNKHCRVKVALSAYSAVYTYVKDHTAPWSKGYDILNSAYYLQFCKEFNVLRDKANAAVADLLANWDAEVHRDLQRLHQIEIEKGIPNLADPADYPTKEELAERWEIDLAFLPLPTKDDFRVEIAEHDRRRVDEQLRKAEDRVAQHVIRQMMGVARRAIDKLSVSIGEEGSIFRDSLIDNVLDVAKRMEIVNLSNDPVVQEKVATLKAMATGYANNKDMLRQNEAVRAKAVSQFDALVRDLDAMVKENDEADDE